MDIDSALASKLGWPKLTYAAVERERRWLCRDVPSEMVVNPERITDLYVEGTQLRLREAIPLSGGEPLRRLSRKADIDGSTRLITSIYLSEHEFELLRNLPGRTLIKTRYRAVPLPGIAMSLDLFEGPLKGLVLAEAEFVDEQAMADFVAPDFAIAEVTENASYRGSNLAWYGLPTTAE